MSMTVKELMNVAKTALNEQGIPEAEVNAKLLMEYMLSMDQTQLFMNWSKLLSDHQCEIYFGLLEQRFARKPLQHIVGKQNFMGEDFLVNENVLIPRPETEILVQLAIDKAKEKRKPEILDLCTGSGIIAITIAKANRDAKVFASDLSEKAVELAKENAKKLNVDVKLKQGDLFKPFSGTLSKKKFDMIISNPPYIRTADITNLEKEVKDYEPHMALDGGENGLEFYKKILDTAHRHLKKDGLLMMEIGYDQGKDLINLAENVGQYFEISVKTDYAGLERIFCCKLKDGK